MIGTDGRVRALGAALALAGAWMFALPESGRGDFLTAAGAVVAALGLSLLVLPGPYRRVAGRFIDFAEDAVDLRPIGALAAAVGAGLIWWALLGG